MNTQQSPELVTLQQRHYQVGAHLELSQDFNMAITQARIIDIGNGLHPPLLIMNSKLITKTMIMNFLSHRWDESRIHILGNKFSIIPVGIGIKPKHTDSIGG